MSINLVDTADKGKVLDDPFFRPGQSNETMNTNENYHIIEQVIPDLKDTPMDVLYKSLPNSQTEFVINQWTFFHVDEIKRLYEYNKKFYSIAVMYRGMGHINIIGYIPSTRNFFMRHDGGSNGYDREAYYNEYTSNEYKPEEFPIFDNKKVSDSDDLKELKISVQYSLDDLMKIINSSS
jgi:hypothetical protein